MGYRENPNELYHFGIKGMKWGVRRFQNKDGSYTAAGLKRRFGGGGGSRSGGKARAGSGTNAEARKAKIKKAAKIAAIAGGTMLAGYGAYRLAKSGKLKGAAEAVRGLKGPSVPRIGGPVKKSFGSRARDLGGKARDVAGQGIAGVQNGAGIVRDKFRSRKSSGPARLVGSRAGQVVDEARRPGAFKRASGAIKGAGDKIYNRMHGVRDVKPTTTALSTAVRGKGNPPVSMRERARAAGDTVRNAARGAKAFAKSPKGKKAAAYGISYGAAAAGFGYSERQRRKSVDASLSKQERAAARARSRRAAVATSLVAPGAAIGGYGAYRYATRNKYRLNSDGSFPKSSGGRSKASSTRSSQSAANAKRRRNAAIQGGLIGYGIERHRQNKAKRR